jgi:hypothetical protein
MNKTCELIWAGLGWPTPEQGVAVVGGPLAEHQRIRTEAFGGYIVNHYCTIKDESFIMICDRNSRVIVGLGIPWPNQEAARINLNGAKKFLTRYRIPGTPSAYALYTGPVRIG